MKISASIYSDKKTGLEALVRDLDRHHIDYFHIDCMDDPGVFDDIRQIRSISRTPIDLHIISSEPEKYFEPIAAHHVELATFQFENLENGVRFPAGPTRYGLAITSETPVEKFGPYKDQCGFILFMTTVPGRSGGTFNKETFRKIREFRNLYPGTAIHVDGGVNAEVAFILRNMGVAAAVTGSYLMQSHSVGAALLDLKNTETPSHYLVKDFMMGRDEIPVLQTGNLSLRDVLQSIEDYKMGFTILVSHEGRMVGIISNADVRRGLLQNMHDLNAVSPEHLTNRDPVSVLEDQTISEMLELVKKQPFPVLYLPVTDREKKITGAVKFNNLIKGES